MNYTEQEIKDAYEKRRQENKQRIDAILAKRNIQINDKVSIEYVTYLNCGPKRRMLHNLVIENILDYSIWFIQQGKKQKSFHISKDDIVTLYKA